MANELVQSPAQAIAIGTGFTEEDVKTLKATVFTELKTESQFKMALTIAKKYDLDPFVKEIWGWVDGKGRLIIIASASGIAKVIRRQAGFKKLIAQAVYPKDEFQMDIVGGEIIHKIGVRTATELPLGAYAIAEIGEEKIIQWVDWFEYAPAKLEPWSPWAKQKSAMIQKCAISVLGRQSIGLSGIYGEEEMGLTEDKAKRDVVIPEIEAEVEQDGQSSPEQEFIMDILATKTSKDLKKLRAKVKQFPNSLAEYSKRLQFLTEQEKNEENTDKPE